MRNLRQEFIAFSVGVGVLSFGEFVTKAGRTTPYFFNAGSFNEGANLGKLARFYAQTLLNSGIQFDMLFGPAYKGITLASSTAVALAELGRNVPFAYNRKEAKDHGEGGKLVGAKLSGNVVIVDDVITAGTAVRESIELIRSAGATPAAVLIALDRMEKSGKDDALSVHSAAQEVANTYQMPVICIANLTDLFDYLASGQGHQFEQHIQAVRDYRARYGINSMT